MPLNFFAPTPGRFGTLPIAVGGRLNTGTLAAGTATHSLGGFPANGIINRATFCAETYPTAATSCVATISKVTGATVVVLTSSLNVMTQTADTPLQFVFLTTTTEGQRTLTTADSLRVTIVTTGAVSVQPDDVRVNVELLVKQ